MAEEIKEEVQEEPQEEVREERDFAGEVQELYDSRPELRGEELPEEVVKACLAGKTVSQAYSDYAKNRHREARIQRQNEKTAARAPVRGVTGGGSTGVQAEDAFLRGFNTAW